MRVPALLAPGRLGRLLRADAMSILRDPMLLYATLFSVAPASLLFAFRATLDAAAEAAWGVEGFSRYAVPVALLIPALLIGWVSGFLLLEDRDERTLLAIEVTPVGKGGFFAYRAVATALATALVTWLGLSLLLPEAGAAVWLVLLAMVPADAVLVAVILPAVARNKVEGLALTKLVNIASLVPLIALFASPPRLLAGIIPSYWVGELLALSGADTLPLWLVAIAGGAVHLFWGVVLFRLFLKRSG